MTDTELSIFAGGLLSLAFSYIPRLREWFDTKDSTTKRLIMAGTLLLVAVVAYGSACADLGLPFHTSCTKEGAVGLATTYAIALMANQAAFLISPKRV